MDISSPTDFTRAVAKWSGEIDDKVLSPLLSNATMLETFWALSSKAEKVFFESTAFQL